MGASLLAIAVVQPTQMQADPLHSRASSAPTGDLRWSEILLTHPIPCGSELARDGGSSAKTDAS
ncbi:hypothetical protein C9I50_26670 [Pseudomonas prosekii]|nr:hypothetical protein C9I50_26670 [Pseudomonas prosekii]